MRVTLDLFCQWIEASKNIVFLGGAGVSTASGIPDFRSEKSQSQVQLRYGVTLEELLSYHYFYEHPEQVYDFFKTFTHFSAVEPNVAHRGLARLEKKGYPLTVITQNIDGLHQEAGNTKVLELHGNLRHFYCSTCEKPYEKTDACFQQAAPTCPTCEGNPRGQGLIRPEMVFYEEDLDEAVWYEARRQIAHADLLIVAGTSLSVYPAASLIEQFQGKHFVILNQDPTPYDVQADLVIRGKVEQVLTYVSQRVKSRAN